MEDPERSNMSSLDLYSDMIGETEGMSAQGRSTTKEHSVMSSMDLYEDMLGETEEMKEGRRAQADLYSDMLGETEGMSEERRGQVEEHSVMSSMDLYEDIIEEERENEKFEELRSEVTKTAGQMEDLMSQMEDIQTEKQTLAAENQALKKNISALFVTAKAELDRKQKEIARLRADLEMMQMRRGGPRLPYSARPSDNRDDHIRPGPSGRDPKATKEACSTTLTDRHQGAYRQSNFGSYHKGESPDRESRREGPSSRDSAVTREASSTQRSLTDRQTGRQQSCQQGNLPDTSRRERTDDLKSHPEHNRPGLSGRESTITREASSSHSDLKDRQQQHGKRNNMASYQQKEIDGEKSRKEVTDVLKSRPEHHRTQAGDLRCSQSPERDKDRRDGTGDRTCRSKHTKPDLKSKETKEHAAHKIDSIHHTERSAQASCKPKQASQDNKLETKEKGEIQSTDEKVSEYVQERSKLNDRRDEVTSPHGPHTPSSPYPYSEEEVKVGQTSPKETVTGGPKTPPEPYPCEDAVSRNLRKDTEKHHKQERRKNRVADDESRRHSREGKKDSAYCSSGSESLSRNSRENSVEDKREEYEKYRKRKENSRADLKSRNRHRDASRESDGRNSREKSSEDKRTEYEKDRRKESISGGDLRQKLRQKKESRNRSQERSSDDCKRDHDKRRTDEQRDHNSRKSKEDRHGKESSGRTAESGRRKHREERSTERDRSNNRLQREGRRNFSRGDKSERSQPSRDTREAHKRKRSSSGEQRHLQDRGKVSPPRKKQYEKDSDGRQQSRERKQSSSRHRDRSEGRGKERSRRRSSERADCLHDNSKEPDRRGHRSKFVSYRDRSEDSDGDPDRYRSLSVETNSTSGSSSACSVAALNDVQKYLPTSFEGSLHASRSREAGLQESGTALTSPVGGSYVSEEPMVGPIAEKTGVLDGQAKEEKSQKQYRDNDEHLTSPLRGRDDRGRSSQNSPDCATDSIEAVSSQHSVAAGDQLQAKCDESEMEEVTSTTTEQPDRRATVREKLLSESAEELGMILAPVKRKREDAKQEYVSSPAAKKKKAAQNTPTKKTRLSPRKSLKESPSKKVICSPTKSPQKISQEGEECTEITPSTLVSPPKTPKKSLQTSPKKAATSPHKSSKKVFKSPQKTPRKSSVGTPKKKSKSPKKTENLVEKCRSIVWTGKSARGKTVNLFHIEYETGDNAAREVFRNSPLLSPVKPPTPQLNLSARSSDVEPPSGEDSCSLPLPAISAQLKTDNKLEMERPVPCYHGNLGFSGLHGNTGTSSQSRTETLNLQQREQRLSESSKIVDNLGFSGLHHVNAGTSLQSRTETVSLQQEEQRLSESSKIVDNLGFSGLYHGNVGSSLQSRTETVNLHQGKQRISVSSKIITSSLPPFASSEDTCRSGSSLEEQDFPSTGVPFSGGLSEISETQQSVSVHLPTNESKQQTNSSESTGPFEVSITAGDATKSVSSDSDCKGNMQTQDGHTFLQKPGNNKDEELVSTDDSSAEASGKGTEREELPLKTDGELRRSVESSLLSISNEFDSSTANLSNEELFAVEVLAQLAAAAKTPTQSPVKPGFSLQQMSPQRGVTKKSPMKVAVTGSTPFRLFSPGRLEPTIAAEVEVGSGCTPKKGSRQRKGMDSPFIPPQQSTSSNKTEKDRHISKKGKKHKKSSEKDLKADEMMLNQRDRKDSNQSEEVLAMSEEDNKKSKSKKAKQDKVPLLEVKPLRSSPRKPQGNIADAAKLQKPSPRKSPRKASTVTPVKAREATNKKKSPTKSITSTTTDISKQKTRDSTQGEKDEVSPTGSLQENKMFTQQKHNEARETSTSLPTPGNDGNTLPSTCVWQTRETEATFSDSEQNSLPDSMLHDDLKEIHNTLILSPKSNRLQTMAKQHSEVQSEKSAHSDSKTNDPFVTDTLGEDSSKQILSSCQKAIPSDPELNQRGSLTVPISSKKCVVQNLQQTECDKKDNPGTESIGKTNSKAQGVSNSTETNDSLKKQTQRQPDQVITSTSLPHPLENSPGTNLVDKFASNQATKNHSAADQDNNVVKQVEALQKEGKMESDTACYEQNEATVDRQNESNKDTPSQTAVEYEEGECASDGEGLHAVEKYGGQKSDKLTGSQKKHVDEEEKCSSLDGKGFHTVVQQTHSEEKLLFNTLQHGVQTSDKQTCLEERDVAEQEHEEGECSSSDEEELDTTNLLPFNTVEENGAHNSIEMETGASFNSDTSLPRPSTPCGLRQEMTLDQFSVLDPDGLRCQSAMSIDVRLIPSTPSGKMGPPSRGATPSGKDAATTPGKSQPSLPKTPAEKRQSGAFRQLFTSPPGGRFASTPAAERPKPPKFQLDVSVISTNKDDDSHCLEPPVMGETVDKTMQKIRDTLREADTVKPLLKTANTTVQDSNKLHTKDVKHLETDKMCRKTEEERKRLCEKKTFSSPGSGRVDTIVASSPKLPPPRRVPSKTDAFRKHMADDNRKKEKEDTRKRKEESHRMSKSVRTPEKSLERKALDPSEFFPDVSSDEDDVSDGLEDQEEERVELPSHKSKVSLGSPSDRHTATHVHEVSSVSKQSFGAPWQQKVEETATRKSVDMSSASAKVSHLSTSSSKQSAKQISANSPVSAVHQKDARQGGSRSDRQAGVTFGRAVPGTGQGSNIKSVNVVDTAWVETGSRQPTTALKEKGTGVCSVIAAESHTITVVKGRGSSVCNEASETSSMDWHEQDVVANTVDVSASISETEAPMATSPSPDQITSLANPPSVNMSSDVSPSVPANIQTQGEAVPLSTQPQHALCTTGKPDGGVAFPQPSLHDHSTFLPHNISSEPFVQNSVTPAPLEAKVEDVTIQGPAPPICSTDGMFRVPLPPANRDPPPQHVSQPAPPVFVAERPVIKLNKFSYAAICALEANYGYEWLWPVKPQSQESLTAKQVPDFSTLSRGEQTKMFVTTCDDNVATHQQQPLQNYQFPSKTQILEPVGGGKSFSSIAIGNQDHRNDSSVVQTVSHGRDRTSGVVTTKMKGKTVKDLLSESRKQKGKSQHERGLVAGREAVSANTGPKNQVQKSVPQMAPPPGTGAFLPGVSQRQGVSQMPGVSHVQGVSQVTGVVPSNVGSTAQTLYSTERNIFDALSRERLDVSSTAVGSPMIGTPILTNQQENDRCTEPTVAMTNQQKLKEGMSHPKDVQPHMSIPEDKACNERITSPNPDIWYQAFGSPKATAQSKDMAEAQKVTVHNNKGKVEPTAAVNKCLEENRQETDEGDLSEGEIISDNEDVTVVQSSDTSNARNYNKDSHCRKQQLACTSKKDEGNISRHNYRQHIEQRAKDDRNSHRNRSQKAPDLKRDRKHTDHSGRGSRRPTPEEGRLREQNYKEEGRRVERGRTEHSRGERVSRDRAAGDQVSRKARRVEKTARR